MRYSPHPAPRSHPKRSSFWSGPSESHTPCSLVGVEIGYNVLHIVVLREHSGEETSFESYRIASYNSEAGLDNLAAVLKQSLQEAGVSPRSCAIWATPRVDRSRVYPLQIPKVATPRLQGAVFWALKREEPFDEAGTVVDFQLDEDVHSSPEGTPLSVTGVLAPREDLEEIQRAFSEAGFPVTGVTLPLFALRNVLRLTAGEPSDNPVALCHVGLVSTSVSILRNGRIVFTRNIPAGMQNLADNLVKGSQPEMETAEAMETILSLENDSGEAPRKEEILKHLRPALERLLRQLERTLQYYQNTYNTQAVQRVYLGGALVASDFLTDFVSRQIAVEVVVPDPFASPQVRAAVPAPGGRPSRRRLSAAFGLALSRPAWNPNLARTYRDREIEKRTRTINYAVFSLFLFLTLLCGLYFGWQQVTLRSLQQERDTLAQKMESLGPPLSEAVLLSDLVKVRAHQATWKTAADRHEGLALMSEIARLTPEHVSLLHFSAEMGSPIPATQVGRNRVLRVEGIVDGERASLETSLTIYVARLDQSQLIEGVEVSETQLLESEEGLHLAFVLDLETDKPIPVASKK